MCDVLVFVLVVFFFRQKTAYELRISDWSSDVCSSDLTLRLVDEVRYAQAFSFKYSPRPGTPAAEMADQIAPEVMDERLQRLQAAINRDQLAFNETSVGRACPVLIERKGKLPGQMLGKSHWLQSVHLITAAAIADMVEVTIEIGRARCGENGW